MRTQNPHKQATPSKWGGSYEPYARPWYGENGFCLFSKLYFTRNVLYHSVSLLSTPFVNFFSFFVFLRFLQTFGGIFVNHSVFTKPALRCIIAEHARCAPGANFWRNPQSYEGNLPIGAAYQTTRTPKSKRLFCPSKKEAGCVFKNILNITENI